MKIKAEHYRDEIVLLRPVYSQYGDITELVTAKAKVYVDQRQVKSVVRALARSYALDLVAQRQWIKSRLNRKAILPFCLGGQRVFVPVKMRHSLTRYDASYGYVDVRYISDIRQTGTGSCLLELCNGIDIEVPSRFSTVVKAQYLGNYLLDSLKINYEENEEE